MVCDPDARPTGESPYRERRRLPLADVVALMSEEAGRSLNLVAQNRVLADPAFEELWADMAFDPDWFDASAALTGVSLWVSPRHAVTPLHYDLENTLLAQVCGRKRVMFASPADTEHLYMGAAGYSTADPEPPARGEYPRLARARLHQAVLEPGDALFLPRDWWHHVRALEVSMSLSLRNFAWSSPAVQSRDGDPVDRRSAMTSLAPSLAQSQDLGGPPMKTVRAWLVALFRSFARARSVRGGSGQYNEQCHPGSYG
jgi:hypothetical protein